MRLNWNHLWKSDAYRKTTAVERRMMEMRFVAARALQRERQRQGVTQQQLADRIDCARATISRLEQASDDVTLDHFLRAMITLGVDDAAIAGAFQLDNDPSIRQLRKRAQEKFFPKPRAQAPPEKQRRWGWRTRRRRS